MDRSGVRWAIRSGIAGLAIVSGSACAQLTPSFGLGTYRIADIIDPAHHMAGTAASLSNERSSQGSGRLTVFSAEPEVLPAAGAAAAAVSLPGFPDDGLLSGQDRSWGITVGIEYGALTLRGAHQDRHVTNIRLFDNSGVNFDASNAIAAANYRLGWGTAYAAYSASRGWGSSPLYNPDNPYSASIAGSASSDSRDMLCGVAMPLTRSTTLLASFIHKNDRELANRDANQIAIGASHTLSRRTDFYAAYSHRKNISGGYADIGGRASNSAINIGMRHAF